MTTVRCRLRDVPKLRLHVIHPRTDRDDHGDEVQRHDVEFATPEAHLVGIVDVDAAVRGAAAHLARHGVASVVLAPKVWNSANVRSAPYGALQPRLRPAPV